MSKTLKHRRWYGNRGIINPKKPTEIGEGPMYFFQIKTPGIEPRFVHCAPVHAFRGTEILLLKADAKVLYPTKGLYHAYIGFTMNDTGIEFILDRLRRNDESELTPEEGIKVGIVPINARIEH